MAIKSKSFTQAVSNPPTTGELSALDAQVNLFLEETNVNSTIKEKQILTETLVVSNSNVILNLLYQEVRI